MKQLEKIFDYKGIGITFKTLDGTTYVNATEMAKPFGKYIANYLQNKSTKEYLQVLENQHYSNSNNADNQLIRITQGTVNPGTWMHEDVALHFAQWLSPAFYVWCNERIKELLKFGFTATPNVIEDIVSNNLDYLIEAATQLKAERAEKERLQKENATISADLEMAAPKVEYHDTVLSSRGLITATVVAKSLGITSAKAMNKMLNDLGVIFKCDGTWVLRADLVKSGYAKVVPVTFPYNGCMVTREQLMWTETGKKFIHQLLKPIFNAASTV